jgi:hypothetical protein
MSEWSGSQTPQMTPPTRGGVLTNLVFSPRWECPQKAIEGVTVLLCDLITSGP